MLSMYVRLFFNICTPEGIIASIQVSLHIYLQNSFSFYFSHNYHSFATVCIKLVSLASLRGVNQTRTM